MQTALEACLGHKEFPVSPSAAESPPFASSSESTASRAVVALSKPPAGAAAEQAAAQPPVAHREPAETAVSTLGEPDESRKRSGVYASRAVLPSAVAVGAADHTDLFPAGAVKPGAEAASAEAAEIRDARSPECVDIANAALSAAVTACCEDEDSYIEAAAPASALSEGCSGERLENTESKGGRETSVSGGRRAVGRRSSQKMRKVIVAEARGTQGEDVAETEEAEVSLSLPSSFRRNPKRHCRGRAAPLATTLEFTRMQVSHCKALAEVRRDRETSQGRS
ncbi:hypothetical protein cyc_07094 [Cyclospora cayetanensis]|uniref:Uncharacterized protein n=1 Tax=Cyclospora cayetanensis TaxID=88456 RepID=A0A1D3CUL0_9EIME|nr:hypothetical protein cyc_07094 [Cyclospora cayetanensis]